MTGASRVVALALSLLSTVGVLSGPENEDGFAFPNDNRLLLALQMGKMVMSPMLDGISRSD